MNAKMFTALFLQKVKINLPEILTTLGIGLMGGAVVTAIVKTPAAHAKYLQHKEKIEELKSVIDPDVPADLVAKDIRKERVKMVGDIVKAYWPTALCMTASAAAVISADGIHCKREAILAGQLGTAIAGLKEVADRIEQKYGKEEADKLVYGTKEVEEIETKTNKKTGKTTEITKIREVIDPDTSAKSYLYCIDETSPFFPKQTTYTVEESCALNAMVYSNLLEIQKYFDNELQLVSGHVLMNDILKKLKLTQIYGKTTSQDWIGWFFNTKDANPKYHNHISFGLDDPINERFRAGLERCVYIRLTPDGSIFQELKNARLIESLFERGNDEH